MAAARDLQVIVDKSDGAEEHRRDRGDPDIWIAEIRPQQRRNEDRRQDQQPAHGRRSALGLVGGRAILAHDLADLEVTQPANQPRAEQKAQHQGGQARARRAERDVLEDTQLGERVLELRQQVEEHQACPSAMSASAMTSVRVPREPLTSTRSPAAASAVTGAAASSAVAYRRTRSRGRPAAVAPVTSPSAAGPPTATSQSTPARAAARPHSSCSVIAWSPSSRISPITAMRRPVCGVAASVVSIAWTAAGLAL